MRRLGVNVHVDNRHCVEQLPCSYFQLVGVRVLLVVLWSFVSVTSRVQCIYKQAFNLETVLTRVTGS